MKQTRRSRGFTTYTILAAVAGTGLVAASTISAPVKGASYRVRVQTQNPVPVGGPVQEQGRGGGGGGFGNNVQLVRVETAGDRAKVEFQLGNPPGSTVSDYFVMVLDSNRVYRVSPDAKTYAETQLAPGGGRGRGGMPGGGNPGGNQGQRGRAGNAGNPPGGGDQGRGGGGPGRGGMNPQQVMNDAVITDIKTNVENLGAGEMIENRPTRKYRIVVNYDFKLYGQPRQGTTTTEIWAVDFPTRVVNPFEAATAAGDTMTMADVTRRIIAESKKIAGVHVKTVTTRTIPIGAIGAEVEIANPAAGPQNVNIVSTTTITALKEEDIDPSIFAIPSDFSKATGFGRGGQ